ncbi:antitoxin HicB [Arthrobacter sp. I2-34]|uniref:Antitoxin HicB n=1 Tax=Arthrobacter hankyongi TaxID=2904801 RepID=A0ABS9LAL6_9MICC|nr:antitoxin HicB [Arthrobacter hankyongi]MCG2623726.1 antitoxin HicB [Arthrobacter hankyongi]
MADPCGNDDLAGFRFHVAWSPEDDIYIATVAEFPSLSWVGDSRLDALCGLERLLERELDGGRRKDQSAPVG